MLNDIAGQADATAAQVAISWLLAQRPWIVRSGHQAHLRLEENTAAATLALSDDQLAAVQQAADGIAIVGARYPEHLDRLTTSSRLAGGSTARSTSDGTKRRTGRTSADRRDTARVPTFARVDEHLAHLRASGSRLGDLAVGAGLEATVPTCPG